jgi:hypothetical protein
MEKFFKEIIIILRRWLFMKLLDEFDVTDRMKLRLQVGEYRDQERIDLRQYIKVDDEFIPTKKGINFSSEWLDKFFLMVDKLRDI